MTFPEAEGERIRAYLQATAAAQPIESLIRGAQQGFDALYGAARAVPGDRWDRADTFERWSPEECMDHIASRNMEVATQILHVALIGELPTVGGAPAVPPTREESIARHQEAMDSLYAHVREADPQGNLTVRWPHKFFGDLNWREWLVFLQIHSADHQRQLERMAARPGD